MKCLLFTFFITSLVMFGSTHVPATYNNAVSGSQIESAEAGSVTLNLNVAGDLTGTLIVKLKHQSGKVSGGAWTLKVLPQDADTTANGNSTLTGSLTSGALSVDAKGGATAVKSAQLSVQSGTGQFQNVTGGSGTLNLSVDPKSSTKLGGPLTLSF